MNYKLSKKGETTRMEAAAELAILLCEKSGKFSIATFSDACVELSPPASRCATPSWARRRTREPTSSAR